MTITAANDSSADDKSVVFVFGKEDNGLKAKLDAIWKENQELQHAKKYLEDQLERTKKDFEQRTKSLQNLSDRVEERVRCPVCLEVPSSGSIYTCPKGHLVCTACYRGTLSNCPICRTRMFNNISLLATTVIENLQHQCKFESEGCKLRVEVGEVERHVRFCNYRPVSCPSHLCGKKVPFVHVVDHVVNECEYSFAKRDGGRCTEVKSFSTSQSMISGAKHMATSNCSVLTFIWEGKYFFLNNKVGDRLNRKLSVQMLGSEEECKMYKVAISFRDEAGEECMKFSDHPLPVGLSGDDWEAGDMLVNIKLLKKISTPLPSNPEKLRYYIWLTFSKVTSGK